MVLRHSYRERRRHQATDRIAHTARNKFRIQMVGTDQAVRPVLFGRADRDDDAARRTQIVLDLMPGGQRKLHGRSPLQYRILQGGALARNCLISRSGGYRRYPTWQAVSRVTPSSPRTACWQIPPGSCRTRSSSKLISGSSSTGWTGLMW